MGRHTSPRMLKVREVLAVCTIRAIAALPFRLNRWLGLLVGWLAATLPGSKARHVTATNLRLCLPELDQVQRQKLCRQSLLETGKSATEMALFLRRPQEGLDRVRQIHGLEPLEAIQREGKAGIILAPHLGCWELLNLWLSTRFTLHVMFNPSGLDAVDALIRQSRQHFRSTLYPTSPGGLIGVVRALKAGGITGILPDQVAGRQNGLFAPFFGQPAWTGNLTYRLIQQTGARAFMGWTKRLPGNEGYEIFIEPPDPDIYSPDQATSVLALNRSVEALIRLAPEQYLWSYKRFRRPVDGRPSPY